MFQGTDGRNTDALKFQTGAVPRPQSLDSLQMRSIAEGEESLHFYHQKMKVIEKVMALIWGGWNEYSLMEDVGG